MDGDPNRNTNGTFKDGNNANPGGQNGHMKGYQPYAKRAAYLMQEYTPEEMREIVTDKRKQKEIGFYDLMILTQMVGALDSDNRIQERETMLDRIEGKASQPLKFSGDRDNPLNTVVTLRIDGVPASASLPETE